MRLTDVVCEFWPWRWAHSGVALTRGIRLHPAAVIKGRRSQIALGRGTFIGARTRVETGRSGRFVTGPGVWMSSDIEVQTATEVRIGSGTTVQRRCTINGTSRIGRGCILAPNVFASSGTHPFREYPHLPIREQERRMAEAGRSLDRPIWVQDDCWLGANVVICPGVTVGKGSIVGANSVVVRDVAPYSVVAGAPARLIGQRLLWQPPAAIHLDREEDLVYVLSGTPVLDAHGCTIAMEIVADEPLRLMITAGSSVRVHYQASGSVAIQIADMIQRIGIGEGYVDFPAVRMPIEYGAVVVDLKLVSAASRASVRVHKVAGSADDSGSAA